MSLSILDKADRTGGGAVTGQPGGQLACLLHLKNLETLLQQKVALENEGRGHSIVIAQRLLKTTKKDMTGESV